MNYSSKIDDWKTSKKNIHKFLLIFYMLKEKKYIQPIFQTLIRIVMKKQFS